MAATDRTNARPPLQPSDIYRPHLGKQRDPLSKAAMSELRAWREASAQNQDADGTNPGMIAGA